MKISTAIRRAPVMLRSALRDLRHGRPLGGSVRTRYAHLGALHTTNSPYEDIARVFAGVEVDPDDVIVDVGCGKGRSLNWFLDRFPQNRIVGIELDPDIAAATAKRLHRHANVTILTGDATTLLPPEGTIFYLFNPFEEPVMERFATALLERSAPATVVYYNAKFLAPFGADRYRIERIDDDRLAHRSAVIRLT